VSEPEEVQLVYVCCRCVPDDRLDDDCLVLYRRDCPQHGNVWHRQMYRAPDGSYFLAVARKPPGTAAPPRRIWPRRGQAG